MSNALPSDQVERIVHLQEPCPPGYRALTLIKQIQYLERTIATARLAAGDEILRVEEVVRDAKGNPILDKEGYPKVIELRKFKRDTVADWERDQLAKVRDQFRAHLQCNDADRQEAGELARFRAEKAERTRKEAAQDAANAARVAARTGEFFGAPSE
jgi:hypothetical protein